MSVPKPLLRDLVWEAELGRVLRALSAAGIPVILLKGAAYRGREYARGERRSRDADLLVKPADFRKARAVLRAAGYDVTVRGEAHATRKGPVPFDLDLHDGIYGEREAPLWKRAEPVEVAGAPALVLASADAFVYALWHGVIRHVAVTGQLLEDLARIAKRGGAGFWPGVAAELKARRLGRAAAVVLPELRSRGVRVPAALTRGKGLVLPWALARGPRGGTGHLLMALSAGDRWRAAGRLARSGARFLRGN